MREFAKHGSLVFAGTLATNVLMYVSYALVQHGLGVDGSGLFMALLAATQLCSVPAYIAGGVVTWLSGHAAARNEFGSLRTLCHYINLAALALLLLSGAATFALLPSLMAYFHASSPWDIVLGVVTFAFFSILVVQRAVFQGAGRFVTYLSSTLVEALLKALGGLFIVTTHGSVSAALFTFATSTVAAYGFSAVASQRLAAQRAPYRLPSFINLGHLIAVALPNGSLNAMTFADSILVRHFLSSYNSGLYAVVSLLGRGIVAVTTFVPTVLMPKAIAAASAGRSALRLLIAACAATLVVLAPLLAVLAFFPQPIIAVLGGRAFAGAAPEIFAYGSAMVMLSLATTLTTYLIGIHRIALAMPVAAVAVCEIGAIALFHPDIASVVRTVFIGHTCAFAITLAGAVIASASPRPVLAREEA